MTLEEAGVDGEQRRVDAIHRWKDLEVAKWRRQVARYEGRLDYPDELAKQSFLRQIAQAEAEAPPLCYGRFELESGEILYIGRVPWDVRDGDPIEVVSRWSTQGQAFHQASEVDSKGLRRKRVFVLARDRRTIVELADIPLGTAREAAPPSRGRLEDPLAGVIEFTMAADRSGQLEDVVATIGPEQDRIIRRGVDRSLVIQGGPGSGKTIVALHRVSYLVQAHQLDGSSVVVVGPNQAFLDYVRPVLPSLGIHDVRLSVLERVLLDGLKADEQDKVLALPPESPELARLKGDVRMASLLSRSLDQMMRIPEPGLVHRRSSGAELLIPAADVRKRVDAFRAAGLSVSAIRDRMLGPQGGWIMDEFVKQVAEPARRAIRAEVLNSQPLKRAARDLFPRLSPGSFLWRVMSDPGRLAEAAAGLFSEAEIEPLVAHAAKAPDEPVWTTADLPLIDEAVALYRERDYPTYRHLVVDEAQDLSPMAARALRRRCAGQVTVLGDLAQATAPGTAAAAGWDGLMEHLARGREWDVERLAASNRIPVEILDFIEPLRKGLVGAGDDVPSSIRKGGRVQVQSTPDTGDALVGLVASLVAAGGLVGVVAASSEFDRVRQVLRGAARLKVVEAPRSAVPGSVHLTTPAEAKGLEYDRVVVVEPAAIVEAERGENALYVALTRATRELYVLHARDLPQALIAPPQAESSPESAADEERPAELDPAVVLVALLQAEVAELRAERDALRAGLAAVADRIAGMLTGDADGSGSMVGDRATRRSPWTPTEDAQLVAELRAGRLPEEVAQHLGRSLGELRERWEQLSG
jgi:predicted ATPase